VLGSLGVHNALVPLEQLIGEQSEMVRYLGLSVPAMGSSLELPALEDVDLRQIEIVTTASETASNVLRDISSSVRTQVTLTANTVTHQLNNQLALAQQRIADLEARVNVLEAERNNAGGAAEGMDQDLESSNPGLFPVQGPSMQNRLGACEADSGWREELLESPVPSAEEGDQ